MRRLSIDQARRVALGAQGFSRPRPRGRIDVRHFRRVVDHVGLVQLDSVNVLARAHYLPFFSRLGPYDRAALDRWLWQSGEMFEYWGHAAAVLPYALRPYMAHRLDSFPAWRAIDHLLKDRPGFIEEVLAEVRNRGPLTLSDLDAAHRGSESWWGWRAEKHALEWLWLRGRLTVVDRRHFAKVYDIPERRWSDWSSDPVAPQEAARGLLVRAARSLGVGTAADLADYFRMKVRDVGPVVEQLAGEGTLVEVEVRGWPRPAYLHPDAVVPRHIEGASLVSPFDPLIWFRPRVERLFGFDYRIEIYVPAGQRQYGYYVLPFLLDGRLVGRVDLKADRKGRRLLVQGAFAEEEEDHQRVATAMAGELREVARWLGLDDIVVERNGNLASHLSPVV